MITARHVRTIEVTTKRIATSAALHAGVLTLLLAASAAPAGALWPVAAGGMLNDVGKAVAVADSGNVYIAGTFQGTATIQGQTLYAAGGTDIFVVKLDSLGKLVWAKSAGGRVDDDVTSIAVDHSENAYITGTFGGSAFFGGTKLMATVTTIANPNCPSFTIPTTDVYVAKLNPVGDWQWATRAGSTEFDEGHAIAVNAEGVFVTGRFGATLSFDSSTVPAATPPITLPPPLTAPGSEFAHGGGGPFCGPAPDPLPTSDVWLKQYPPWSPPDGITACNLGCPIEAQTQFGCVPGSVGCPVESVECRPVHLWFYARDCFAKVNAYCPSASNYSAICQQMHDNFVAKLDFDGHWLWGVNGGATGLASDSAIAVDNSGDVYIATTNTPGNSWIVKLQDSPSGGQYVGAASTGFAVKGIATDGNQNVALTGSLGGTSVVPAATFPNQLPATTTAANPTSITYGSTTVTEPADNPGAVVAKIHDAGDSFSQLWAKGVQIPASGGQSFGRAVSKGVTIDASGEVFFAGTFSNPLGGNGIAFGATTLTSSNAADDVFAAGVDASGNWLWANHGGGNGTDGANAITVDAAGEVTVAGSFNGTAAFGTDLGNCTGAAVPGCLYAAGGSDAFAAKLTTFGDWVLFQQWIVGREVPRPSGALAVQPDILIPGVDPAQAASRFLWAPYDQKLFAVQPLEEATVAWKVSTDAANMQRIRVSGESLWPDNPLVHVATAPVDLELGTGQNRCASGGDHPFYTCSDDTDCGTSTPCGPLPPASVWTYSGKLFSTSSDSADANKIFNATQPGYSVLLYANGPTAELTKYSAGLDVVLTVDPIGALPPGGAACAIGTALTDPDHRDPNRKNGWVYYANSMYDGAGADAAYDRTNRQGPILPVNLQTPATVTDDMVVAWYMQNARGIAWPAKAVRYDCEWPTNADEIVIASGIGSDVSRCHGGSADGHACQSDTDCPVTAAGSCQPQPGLDPAVFPSMQIYNQPDPAQPGFNPNDEHALFEPSNHGTGFKALFALRSDIPQGSQPYGLLKYRDPATQEWAMHVYHVVPTDGPYQWNYAGTAGTQITPPYPLPLLAPCMASTAASLTHSLFEDYRTPTQGWIGWWARAEGTITAQYFYPLQPGFVFDLDRNGVQDQPVGTCLPWLDRLPGGAVGTPVTTNYNIVWPPNPPVLEVGETLFKAKHGLPDMEGQAAAEIVFDELDPDGVDPTTNLAKIFDPLSERRVPLTALPTADLATGMGAGGKTTILGNVANTIKVPFHLRRRLSYDPLNAELVFAGAFDDSGLGEPLLLPNVMTDRERLLLLSLSSDANYQTAVQALYDLSRNPNSADADDDGWPDHRLLIGYENVLDDTGNFVLAHARVLGPKALTAGDAQGTGYVTLTFNNDPSLNGLPISVNVIRVDCGPYQGQVEVIPPDNVFDEQLTVRHSGDFGGNSDSANFQWFYTLPNPTCDPADIGTLPQGCSITAQNCLNDSDCPAGEVCLVSRACTGSGASCTSDSDCAPFGAGELCVPRPPTSQWSTLDSGVGKVDVTFHGPAITTLANSCVVARYTRPNPICNNDTVPSQWAGSPQGTFSYPRAQLAEGWITRVVRGLNPFDQRVSDFHESAVNTFASALTSAGERYEGDIAFNPSAANVNSFGLIQAYETVLRRAKTLSIDGTPPLELDAVDDRLLDVAGKTSDLYMLLGNEAFADAGDPTIGFDTDGVFGTLAPSIFAFENQVPSLLEEELGLLRGSDHSRGAAPVYNRLIWNFTSGDGQVAYQQNYNIQDENADGKIDFKDARILYPQGHGDAWGHYLTALTTYYGLLRHPRFSWVPRTESVSVGGQEVEVDYFDERKFAAAAAALARTGAQVVDLTYRQRYVEDPAGQWQGYKDPNLDRAFGVADWAQRAGQAAYLNWVAANSILPPVDAVHTGLRRIDRTTVPELAEISTHLDEIQTQLDTADRGLNPLGLAKNVVPFDIDPSLITASAFSPGKTHFEQIYDRATKAMNNAVMTFNHANELTQLLRRTQDSVDDFRLNVAEQERDYNNRLIEIFGYPYPEDIGPGGAFPQSGYAGPDIVHFNYVEPSALNGADAGKIPTQTFTVDLTTAQTTTDDQGNTVLAKDANGDFVLDVLHSVSFNVSPGGLMIKPTSWTTRRAPGEIQMAWSDLLENKGRFQQALQRYQNTIAEIITAAQLIEDQKDFDAARIEVLNDRLKRDAGFTAAILALKATSMGLELGAQQADKTSDIIAEGIPKIVGLLAMDVGAPIRALAKGGGFAAETVLKVAKIATEETGATLEAAKALADQAQDIRIEQENRDWEVGGMALDLEAKLREEPAARLEVLTLAEEFKQAVGRYQATLAKGQRLFDELVAFRKKTAAATADSRYKDMSFRVFRNDALQKYRAQFDLAARYTYLAAAAYDYETNLVGSAGGAGQQFFTDIVRQRSLGEVANGEPIPGSPGLADPLGRLAANFAVMKSQLGFNNPQTETNRFSLRTQGFRIHADAASDATWRSKLQSFRVDNLFDVPEFRRFARPFAPESLGPQPGLVIPLSEHDGATTVTFGLNFFGWPLGPGDSAYDPTLFATKVRTVGVWFGNYDLSALSNTPRVYLIPVGADRLRSPSATDFTTRDWTIIDQKVPVPFPIGASDLSSPSWIPQNDELSGFFGDIRQFSSFRAFADTGVFDPTQTTSDSRLIGRSVWNTRWLLIIPGGTFLYDPNQGLDTFICGQPLPGMPDTATCLERDGNGNTDIEVFFQTYAYSGD